MSEKFIVSPTNGRYVKPAVTRHLVVDFFKHALHAKGSNFKAECNAHRKADPPQFGCLSTSECADQTGFDERDARLQ